MVAPYKDLYADSSLNHMVQDGKYVKESPDIPHCCCDGLIEVGRSNSGMRLQPFVVFGSSEEHIDTGASSVLIPGVHLSWVAAL